MDFVRPDYIFSYWIFAWFLIYYFVPIPPLFKKYANPLLALWIGIIENLGNLLFSYLVFPEIWQLKHYLRLVNYLIMLCFMKILPIYLLSSHKIMWRNDIFVLCFVFAIYNFYLFLNGTNIVEIYQTTIKSIQKGENKTPLFYLFSLIKKYPKR
jgi:hypothetical protein